MTTTIHPIAPAPARPPRIRVPKLFALIDPPPAKPATPADLHFVERNTFQKLLSVFFRMMGAITPGCPVGLRGQGWIAIMPVTLIGQAVGFGDEHSQRLLQHHHQRRLRAWWIHDRLGMLCQMLMLWFGITAPLHLVPAPADLAYWTGRWTLGIGLWAVLLGCMLTLLFLQVAVVVRLIQVLVDRYFAETICATQALYLLTDLQREDVLARPDRRWVLVQRFDALTRATRLLALRYRSDDPALRLRVHRHFKEIARHTSELRMWAVAPQSTTLEDLRREVGTLARIFITASYGEVRWRQEPEAPEAATGWRSLLRGAGRATVLLAPFAALAYLLVSPQAQQAYVGSWGILVLVAWASVALDTTLQLGIVASVVGLAKSIKELK